MSYTQTPRRDVRTGASCHNYSRRWSYVVVCFAQFIVASAASQLANSPWPDYGGGYLNQHRSPYAGPSSQPVLRWQYDLANLGVSQFQRGYHQPILLPDGTLVLNTADSSNDQIVAVNANGTVRWDVDDSSLGPWLAADQGGHIYTIRNTSGSSNTGRLRSVSFTGTSEWQSNLTGSNPTQNGPAIGRNGAAYAAVDFSPLRAFNSDGTLIWTSSDSGYYVNPAIAQDGAIIVGGANLTAISPNGAVLWQRPTRTEFNRFPAYLSPAIGDDGTIYAGQINVSNLVALTPAGALKMGANRFGRCAGSRP